MNIIDILMGGKTLKIDIDIDLKGVFVHPRSGVLPNGTPHLQSSVCFNIQDYVPTELFGLCFNTNTP